MESTSHEKELCHLLDGTFDYIAQLVLLIVAFGGLVYKRHVEQPRRPIKIWLLDISKQVFSGLAGHSCNMITATLIALDVSNTSPCSWYFVVYMVDTVFGVSLALLMHEMILLILRFSISGRYSSLSPDDSLDTNKTWQEHIIHCGNYGNPISLYSWFLQMIEWVIVTLVSRLVCGVAIFLLKRFVLIDIAKAIDSIFAGHPHFLLFCVMVMCPVLMNLVQAWIQDNFLKLRMQFVDSSKEVEIEQQQVYHDETPL